MFYVSLTEANEYFSSRLNVDAWAEASDADKDKALAMAAKAINRQPLKGRKTDPAHTLAFPRYPDKEIPQAVKEACCEEALAIFESGNSQRRKLQQEGVQSFSLGNMSETFAAGAGKGLLSQEAKELLRPWLLGSVFIT